MAPDGIQFCTCQTLVIEFCHGGKDCKCSVYKSGEKDSSVTIGYTYSPDFHRNIKMKSQDSKINLIIACFFVKHLLLVVFGENWPGVGVFCSCRGL